MSIKFPDGKPKSSETLANGKIRHVMKDGRVFELRPNPDYVLSYQSKMFDAKPGDGYDVEVSVLGKSKNKDFYEAWNFKTNELRWYSYDKTLKLTDIATGKVFGGYAIWQALNPDAEDDDD